MDLFKINSDVLRNQIFYENKAQDEYGKHLVLRMR